jgi:hypothetical protein
MAPSKPMCSTGLGERSLSGSPDAFETSQARKFHNRLHTHRRSIRSKST